MTIADAPDPAAKLDRVREMLDAALPNDIDTRTDIMIAVIEYAGDRALAALDKLREDWRKADERKARGEPVSTGGEE